MPDGDDAEQVWRDKLDGHRLADDCTPRLLADRYGAPPKRVLDNVCNEAIQHVVADGRTEFAFADFERAWESVDTDAPAAADDTTPSSVARNAGRDELEERVRELEHETERLRRVANRDVALLKGTVKRLVGADPNADIEDLPALAADRGDGGDDA